MKKKILKVEITKIPIVTYTYSYCYKDNKEITVRGENYKSIDSIEKLIKKRIKKLSNDDYKLNIVEKKIT